MKCKYIVILNILINISEMGTKNQVIKYAKTYVEDYFDAKQPKIGNVIYQFLQNRSYVIGINANICMRW